MKMNNFEAIMIAEGAHPSTEQEYESAWQYLIDTGLCWQLQGWFGRSAQRLIDSGVCSDPSRGKDESR